MSKKKKSIKEEYDEMMNLIESPESKAQIREWQERTLAQARERLRAVYAAAAAHPNTPIPYDEFGNCIMAIPKEEWLVQQKTAFLTELSELLRKYDASVRAEIIGFEGMKPTMSYTISNEQFYLPQQGYITADNVLNYDKE